MLDIPPPSGCGIGGSGCPACLGESGTARERSVTIPRMKSSVRLTVAVALALVAAQCVQASPSAYTVTPSAAQAKHATRLEVATRYTILDPHTSHHAVTLNIGCRRLKQRLYRCSFFGETATDLYEYAVSGRSMVRLTSTHA
jgi:hypothetical protein